MIFKVTIRDNDFTEQLERFFSKFQINVMDYIYDNGNDVIGGFTVFNRFQKLLNPNVTNRYNAEDKQFIKDTVLKALNKYFNDEYISKNLELEIVKSYTDKWENGEVLYYFSNNDKYLVN